MNESNLAFYDGTWNSIRETVICNLVDKDGAKHEVRLLVDTGATVSTLTFFTLYKTRGNWDVGTIPPLRLHGVNSSTVCDMMCKATLTPGNHLKSDFKKTAGLAENFELKVDFLVIHSTKVFSVWKRELPESIRLHLANEKFHLADPEQINPGFRMLYMHGILGVRAISQMNRQTYQKVLSTEMTLCRSSLGDLLFGASHFMPHQPGVNTIPLTDKNHREEDVNYSLTEAICSLSLVQHGLEEVKSVDEELGVNSRPLTIDQLTALEESFTELLE